MSPPPKPVGLSTGATVGIGIGTAVGVIVLVAVAGFYLFKRRKDRTALSGVPELQNDYKLEAIAQNRPAVHEICFDDAGNEATSPGRHELSAQHQ
jgi:LPXTG-motif cell wall-anchored protein